MTRGDYVVLGLCVLLLPLIFMRYGLPGSAGAQARIMSGDRTYGQVPLHRNHTYRVGGTLGSSEIEVKDGKIRFISSPCQGKQCIHAGWANRGGEFVACLPNRVSVVVLGQGVGGDYYDSINF
jgi:hypothetical protein